MARQKPKMIRAIVIDEVGNKSEMTVHGDQIGIGPRLHEKLPPDLEARADKLFDRIGKYRCYNLRDWHDGFLRDVNPEEEIQNWEIMADVTDRLHVDPPKTLRKLSHRQFYQVLVSVFSARVVDIPSQLPWVTDEQVDIIRRELSIEFFAHEVFGNSGIDWGGENDPRRGIQEAQVIMGVDVKSRQEFILFGRKEEVERQSDGLWKSNRTRYAYRHQF